MISVRLLCAAAALCSFMHCGPSAGSVSDRTMTVEVNGYIKTCIWKPIVSEWKDGSWSAVENPLVSGKSPVCYVDDVFVPFGQCDYVSTVRVSRVEIPLVKYVHTGMRPAPPEIGDGMLPAYKTVPLRGELNIRFSYYRDSLCRTEESLSMTFFR